MVNMSAKGEIDIKNVSKMTRQECGWLPYTSFFFPNATDKELGVFYNESAYYCKKLLWPQPPH